MTTPSTAKTTAPPGSIGTGVLVLGLASLAVGLLIPLLMGSFSESRLVIVGALEIACLLSVWICARLMVGRLQASRQVFWALSRQDELTRVGNYRALRERLTEEVARHSRRAREFALVLIDLDGFKQVNERFGHLEGDRVLAEIGAALQDEVRSEDSVFRQGGDEFAVIAPETNAEEAEELAARLRTRLRKCGEGMKVSAGTGFAVFPVDGRAPDELLGFADRDLLGAKRGGRAE